MQKFSNYCFLYQFLSLQVLLFQSKMKMENNIFHGPPIKEIPNITLGKHIFDCLRSNGQHIVQVS